MILYKILLVLLVLFIIKLLVGILNFKLLKFVCVGIDK